MHTVQYSNIWLLYYTGNIILTSAPSASPALAMHDHDHVAHVEHLGAVVAVVQQQHPAHQHGRCQRPPCCWWRAFGGAELRAHRFFAPQRRAVVPAPPRALGRRQPVRVHRDAARVVGEPLRAAGSHRTFRRRRIASFSTLRASLRTILKPYVRFPKARAVVGPRAQIKAA